MNRREFARSAAAVSMLAALPRSVHSFPDSRARRVGLIGSGWYGKVDLLQLMLVEPVDVVSVCDVDSNLLNEAADLIAERQASKKRPPVFADYRKQLAEVEHDLILVGTPDHWHALPTIAALESGAHVFCQKPTACDVLESKAMLDAARKHNKVVQIGTQRRGTPHLIEAKEQIVDAGLLGDVAMVEMCCYYHMRRKETVEQAPDKPVPEHLDWEMWTGPAQLKPYNDIAHPGGWRMFQEYANGIMGDMCVHMFDLTRWMLGLGWPNSINSTGGIYVDTDARANIPDTQNAIFKYDDLDVVWTQRSWGHATDPEYPWASIIYGSNGTLKLSINKYEFIPRWNGERRKADAVREVDQFPTDLSDKDKWRIETDTAPGVRGLMKDWLNCIDNGGLPVADIEQGHISSATCFLANISMDLGRTLNWDPETHTVIGDDEANTLLKRPYREPWVHPADVQ